MLRPCGFFERRRCGGERPYAGGNARKIPQESSSGLPKSSHPEGISEQVTLAQEQLLRPDTLTGDLLLPIVTPLAQNVKGEANQVVNAFAVDPQNTARVFAATEGGGIFLNIAPGGGVVVGGSGGGSSVCFIATAAYGSPLADEVMALREYRDECLLSNPAGRLFVGAYYRLSPPLAGFVSSHSALRKLTRVLLWPIVFGCKAWLGTPACLRSLICTAILIFGIVFLFVISWRMIPRADRAVRCDTGG